MDRQTDNRRGLKRRVLLSGAALVPVAAVARPSTAQADPAEVGSWSAPFNLGGVPIHATLMRNDEVLFFQDVEGSPTSDRTSYVATWNWRTNLLREAPFGYDRDVFCAHHNALADGRILVTGGHDYNTSSKQDEVGVAECDIYDPLTRRWSRIPAMGEKRWYPTNVFLPNGRTLVFGGTARTGVPSRTVDEYDAATNTMRRLPSSSVRTVGMYPRLHLMANGRVLMSGPFRTSTYFNPASSSWSNVAAMQYGQRGHGAVALLPGAQQVLTAGGGSPTRTAEILDTSQSSPRWRYTGSLNFARMLANTVVLPDGQVLLVGGGAAFKYTRPVRTPELFDPATETWTAMAAQQAGRMYHATALLLPDGRVWSAGQDSGSLSRHAEIFSPPYLFRGPRPTVTGSPAFASPGGQLQFSSPEATDLSRVVLIRPGSHTHEVDSEQRSIPLTFTASGTTVTAQVPSNTSLMLPGWYLLFALNRAGVPAVAPWIRVG